jgi:hypothetical protein
LTQQLFITSLEHIRWQQVGQWPQIYSNAARRFEESELQLGRVAIGALLIPRSVLSRTGV